jgi:rhamnulokinase
MAAASPPFGSLINPGDQRFLGPDEMPRKIADFCAETGQPIPVTPGQIARCILESLALLYRRTAAQIGQLIGRPLELLHIVGGGSKNQLLNRFTANALQVPVLAGPVEATAAGNILVQALALGHIDSLRTAREIVVRSSQLSVVAPVDADDWARAYERFLRLTKRPAPNG